MILQDTIAAFSTKAAELGYTFKQGDLTQEVDIPSSADDWFIWMDRPVNVGGDAKLFRTKSGVVTFSMNIHSLEVHTQAKEYDQADVYFWDRNIERLITLIGDTCLDNPTIAKALRGNSDGVFEKSVHQDKYIGLFLRLDFTLDYCE